MPGNPPLEPRLAHQLPELMAAVRAASNDVDALRTGRVDPALLVAARGVLLEALERLAAELARRRLPLPPALRDELRLQRGIRGALRLRLPPTGPSRP